MRRTLVHVNQKPVAQPPVPKPTLRVRLTSDGTPFSTHIYDADSGAELLDVQRVQLTIDAPSGQMIAYLERTLQVGATVTALTLKNVEAA